MCVAGMPGMRIPASICSTWAQRISGIGIPVRICTTCVAGVSGMRIPASICSSWAQEASGIDIPVSICTTCVWQECLECAFLLAFAAPGLRSLLELTSLSAFAPHVCVAGMPGMCIPASICSTWAHEAPGIEIPVSICTTCVCGRNACNVHSCQHLQHLGSGGFRN